MDVHAKNQSHNKLDEELLLQVKALAVSLKVSRSRVFEMAMEEFLRRHAEVITLNNADRDDFVQALESEEEPNEALVQAAKELNEKYTT